MTDLNAFLSYMFHIFKMTKNRTFDAQLEENKITWKEEVVTYFTVKTPAPALRENQTDVSRNS